MRCGISEPKGGKGALLTLTLTLARTLTLTLTLTLTRSRWRPRGAGSTITPAEASEAWQQAAPPLLRATTPLPEAGRGRGYAKGSGLGVAMGRRDELWPCGHRATKVRGVSVGQGILSVAPGVRCMCRAAVPAGCCLCTSLTLCVASLFVCVVDIDTSLSLLPCVAVSCVCGACRLRGRPPSVAAQL